MTNNKPGIFTMLDDGTVIEGDHPKPIGPGLINAASLNWLQIMENEQTGVHLNEKTQIYEFRGYYNANDYVIIGVCARVTAEEGLQRWIGQCEFYAHQMSEAN